MNNNLYKTNQKVNNIIQMKASEIDEIMQYFNISEDKSKDLIKVMEKFGKAKFENGYKKTLLGIAKAFLDKENLNKVTSENDKRIFTVIGESIIDFPMPHYE